MELPLLRTTGRTGYSPPVASTSDTSPLLPAWPPNVASAEVFAQAPELFPWRVEAQKSLWGSFVASKFVSSDQQELLQDALGMYPDLDRVALYCMIRWFKPKVVLEIGSGESTHVAKAALEANGVDTAVRWAPPYPPPHRATTPPRHRTTHRPPHRPTAPPPHRTTAPPPHRPTHRPTSGTHGD